MATSSVLPPSPSHFMRPSSFATGDWADARHTLSQPQSSSSTVCRPKLSLNTTCSRSAAGKGSGLRLETLSAVSPTVRNTFKNGFHDIHSAVPVASIARTSSPKPLSTRISRGDSPPPSRNSVSTTKKRSALQLRLATPTVSNHSSRPTSPSSRALDIAQPAPTSYIQPANLRSILSNSPQLKRTLSIRSPLTPSTPPISAPAPTTPVKKRVCFSSPLVEEITTSTYTFKHSDIQSRTPSPPALEADEKETDAESTASDSTPEQQSPGYVMGQAQRDGTAEASDENNDHEIDDSEMTVQTPVAGRSRREREWVWTLGPIGHHDEAGQQLSLLSEAVATALPETPKAPLSVCSSPSIPKLLRSPAAVSRRAMKDRGDSPSVLRG